MKTLLISVFVLLGFFLVGCYPDVESKTIPVSGESSNLRTFQVPDTIMGIPFPGGTITTSVGNGIDIQLPQGYRFGGIDNQNNIHMRSSGTSTVTCECNDPSTGSCAPFETNQQVGCASDKSNICNNCTMTVSASGIGGSPEIVLREYYIFTPVSSTTGYTLEILIVNDLQLWNQLDWADGDVFQNNEQLLTEIIDFKFEDYSEGDLTVSVAVAIDSSRFLLEIPYNSLEDNMMYTSSLFNNSGEETAASCSGCDGDCKFSTQYMGRIRTCINCSSGCTLSF